MRDTHTQTHILEWQSNEKHKTIHIHSGRPGNQSSSTYTTQQEWDVKQKHNGPEPTRKKENQTVHEMLFDERAIFEIGRVQSH